MIIQNNSIRREHSLVFRQWRSKGYSLFATLKKVVKISVLSIAYFQVVPVQSAATEKDTSEVKMQFDLSEVEVSASEPPAVYSQIMRVLTVIDSKEIEHAPVESVQDMLAYVAGADIRQRGAMGVQADVGIRGGTFDQTLILLNGINITDPQTGHHNLNLPVSLSQIKRIEVLEGPAARIYGASAFSGAINIVTRQPAGYKARINIGVGSFGYFNSSLSGSFQTGKMNHLIAGNRKNSDGYIENTDFEISNLFYCNEFQSEQGKFSFQGGLSGKAFGANDFYTPIYPNQFEETTTIFSSARWESATRLHITPAVYWRRHADKFMLFRENPPEWYTSHNFHRTHAWGANLYSWFRWEGGKTAMGAEFRRESILSNVLGEEMEVPIEIPGKEVFFTKSKRRSIRSLFVDHHYRLQAFSFSAGVMANHISDAEEGWNIFPGLDVGYELGRPVKIIASFNTSMRMPTFTDLYYSGPANVGNPGLKPEKSMTLEGGIKLMRKFIRGHFIVFYRQGKNMIDWVKQSSDELWQAQNLTEIKSLGTEIQVQFFPADKLGEKWPDNIKISYFYNNQEKENSGYISNYVLDNLRHKLIASASQPITKNIYVNLRGTFQDREGTFSRFENRTAAGEVSYNPFWLFDGKVVYSRKNLKLYVSANNIFNCEYFDLGNIVQPGRWIKTGVFYQLNFK